MKRINNKAVRVAKVVGPNPKYPPVTAVGMGAISNSMANKYISGTNLTSAQSLPVHSYINYETVRLKKWELRAKDLYKFENVRIYRPTNTSYRIITDKFSIDVQETTNSVVIFKSYGDYDRVMEYEATPQSVFDMFTQHSDGVVHYANGMDINIKIENMLMI